VIKKHAYSATAHFDTTTEFICSSNLRKSRRRDLAGSLPVGPDFNLFLFAGI